MLQTKSFQFVDYLWNEEKARSLEGDEVALFLYRSNLLGADLRITNFGGGNTSCKTDEKDPLTGEPIEVMWVKGSGGDLGTLKRSGIAGLDVGKLRNLENRYRGLDHEDEMVALFQHCIFDLDSRAPSIDTPLHGFLPFKHIDHLHPDALIAIAAAKNSEAITKAIWGDSMGWLPWQRPGFDLALRLRDCLEANPGIRGIVLGGHGVFTWGDTSLACYENSLEVIETAAAYLAEYEGKDQPVFGGNKIKALEPFHRLDQASKIAPVLRGLVSGNARMIGHFTDDDRVLEFVNSQDLDRLAPLGTSCPDHFLRTKIKPLVIPLAGDTDLADPEKVREQLTPAFEQYRTDYKAYYETCKHPDSPALRDPNPVILLWPGVGMFAFAKNKQTARVSSEFYINAINVMRGAEAISEYVALPQQEAFNIEYWLLEEAKLKRQPPEKPLSRKVVLITGSGGGIGKGIAKLCLEEGACVILSDINEDRLLQTGAAFQEAYGKDNVRAVQLDTTREDSIAEAFEAAALEYGGVDVIVNNAGLSVSRPLENTSEADWQLMQDVMVKGQFAVSKLGTAILRKQGFGGDIINIVSKNALVAGPNNVAYGTAKAAQLHMSRLLAAELGKDGIRVNVVNPDAVIQDSNIWANGWAAGRAKAYGITEEELPAFYAKRTLLNETIVPEDIAKAVFVLIAGYLQKSTGNVLNVDGGLANAFVR